MVALAGTYAGLTSFRANERTVLVPVNRVPSGIYGNAARGLIYGPPDVVRLQLCGEFFDAFNLVKFGNPNTTVSSTSFGLITGGPRAVSSSSR